MTRTEMEARRLRAIPDLLNPALSLDAIAKPNGVSRMTVHRWRRMVIVGESLEKRHTPGRPPRLKPEHEPKVLELWKTKPRWTQARFAAAVAKTVGVRISGDHMGRILHRLGLIEKRPYGENRQ